MNNTGSPAHAPWGYEYLQTQQEVDTFWVLQIMQSATLGAYAWDVILSLVEDCEFVLCRKINYVTYIYVTNRISAILCMTAYFVVGLTNPFNCETMSQIVAISEGITQLTSSALLLLRVFVLYRHQICVVAFMIALLFPGPILNIVAWFPVTATTWPVTGGCEYTSYPPNYAYLSFLFQAIFDLLAFILCTVKLLESSDISLTHLFRRSTGIGTKLRREFLRGGFIYYIPNVIIQTANIVLIILTFQSNPIGVPTTSLSDAIASAQALRITRKLWKAGLKKHNNNDFLPHIGEGRPYEPPVLNTHGLGVHDEVRNLDQYRENAYM